LDTALRELQVYMSNDSIRPSLPTVDRDNVENGNSHVKHHKLHEG